MPSLLPVRSTRRARLTPLAVVTGVVAAATLSLSMTGTLSAFTASITNSNNTAASGTLTMQEQTTSGTTVTCTSTDATTVSNNSASCASINKFGGSTTMVPGQTVTTAIAIKNTGTVNAAAFTLAPTATCTQAANGSPSGNATDLCAKMNVVITSGATTVFSGTLASLGTATASSFTMPAAPAAGVSVPFSFAVTLNSSAGNAYQGLAASLPLIWTFTS